MGDRMELASLAIAIDSREVRTAREWLDLLTGAGTRAERSLGRVGAGGKTAAAGSRESASASRDAARGMDAQANSAQRLTAMIRSYASAAVGAFGVREVVQAADAWQGLENRLRLVTRSHSGLQVAMNDVYAIAQRTSQQIDSVGQVYQRFAQNAGALGLTQEQIAGLAETTAKAIAISGSEAAAAEGAMNQFGQALAAGALRGEEFNSVMEGAPGLAQALTRGLGVPIGALRQMAADGEITGKKIVEALTKARDSVDDQFGTRIKTVSQSMVELGNSITRYVGEASKATGAANWLADGVTTLAEAIDKARGSMDSWQRELDGFKTFGELVVEAWNAVDGFAENFKKMLDNSGGGVQSLGDSITTSFTQSFLNTAKELDSLYDAFMGTIASLGAGFRTLGENIAATFVWGFEKALASFSELTATVSGWLNSTFGTTRFNFAFANDPGDLILKSLRDEADRARVAVEGTLGAYDALAKRIGDEGVWRAAEDAMSVYSKDMNKASAATDVLVSATDKKKRKLTEAEKAAQAFAREREQYLKGMYGEISSLSDQADKLEDQVRYYGLSESALNDLTIARLEEQKAALMGIEGAEEEIAIRQRMIEQYQRMGVAMRGLEAKEAEKAAWEQWSRDVESIFQQVGQSLTDAIFEGGKSGRDLVKDLFKTLTLRVLINPVMNSIQGAVTNSLGGVFGFNNPQQQASADSPTGIMGLLGKANDLYGAFTGNVSGTIASGISSLGQTLGSEALNSFAAGMKGATLAPGLAGPTTQGASGAMGAGNTIGANMGSILGYGAAIYSLTQGKYGSAAGTAIGTAILPGIGTAIGGLVGGLADSLFGDDEPKTRHGQWEWAEMSGDNWGMKYRDDRQPAGTGDAIVNYARSAVDSANDMFGKLGVNAAIEHFYATTNSSRTGEFNGVASGGSIRAGDSVSTFGLMGLGGDRTKYGYGGWSKEEMLPRLQTDIQLSILQAFQTQVDSLPGLLADMIRGVNIRGLDAAGAQALAEQFNAIIQGVDQFRTAVESLPFENLKNLSFDAAANLIQFAGGLENLNAGLGAYYENFYSEAEQQQKVWADIGKVLEGVGLTVPKTRDSFRALVEAQDLTTEAGQRAYAALLGVSGAFAQVATASEQAAQETARAAKEQRDILIGNLESAYSAVVSAGQAEITRLQQSFGVTDSALEAYRTKVQALESQFGAMFSSIEGYIKELRGNVEASATAQYREARALISTALVTGQLPDAGRLSDALQAAQRGVTGQVYASRFEQEKAYTILANEMQALKDLASPELDTAKATLAQLEEQYALLRGTNRIAGDSLSALEQQVRLALSTEEAARSQISLIEQQLEEAKQQYEALLGIDSSIKDLATAMREFAAAAVAMAKPSAPAAGGGTGGWTPGSLPAGAETLSAAERYVLYNSDLLQDQASSGMSVEQYAQYHWNTYGQYEDRDIGLRSYAVGTGYVPQDMTANIHQGEIIIDPRSSDILRRYGIGVQSQGGDRETQELLRQVVQRLDRLEAAGRATAVNTSRMDQKLEDAMQGGDAIRTREVAIA